MSSLVTYREFKSSMEALPMLQMLDEHQIPYQVENIAPPVDVTFTGGNALEDTLAVKIAPENFARVDRLYEAQAEESVVPLEEDYYLYEFSNDELIQILEHYDEWSATDYVLARQILEDRGKEYSDDDLEHLKKNRIEHLRQPAKGSAVWVFIGFLAAFIGGLLGVFMGYHYHYFKKRLPNGEQVYAYDASTRSSGKLMLFLGIVSIVFWSIFISFGMEF